MSTVYSIASGWEGVSGICDGLTRHKVPSLDGTSRHTDPPCDGSRCGLYKAVAAASGEKKVSRGMARQDDTVRP